MPRKVGKWVARLAPRFREKDPRLLFYACPLAVPTGEGLGVVMGQTGNSFGHNGSGPGFSTSCFHFPKPGVTVSVLMPYDGPDDAAYKQMRVLAARHGDE